MLEVVASLLEESFDVVGLVSDGQAALEAVLALEPDLVVLDISMPDGNGIQVLEAIKKPRRVGPDIIMLTNFAHEAYRERCRELGAAYFFDKSAEFEEAVEMIRELSQIPYRSSARLVRS